MTADPHTLVGPYVLDALPDDERDRFEEHLDRCPDCRAEAAELFAAAAHLGQAAAVVPPAALRAQVLAEVEVTRQVPPGAPLTAHARPRWPLALAAAALVAVVVALSALLVQADNRADQAEQLAAIIAAPDAETVVVSGDGGSMRVVASEAHGSSVVIADEMAAPPPGSAYALWFDEDGEMVLHGVFTPDSDGEVRIKVPGVPTSAIGVTVEPAGTEPEEPTFPAVAFGEVS